MTIIIAAISIILSGVYISALGRAKVAGEAYAVGGIPVFDWTDIYVKLPFGDIQSWFLSNWDVYYSGILCAISRKHFDKAVDATWEEE